MADYKSIHTGAEIDDAVTKIKNGEGFEGVFCAFTTYSISSTAEPENYNTVITITQGNPYKNGLILASNGCIGLLIDKYDDTRWKMRALGIQVDAQIKLNGISGRASTKNFYAPTTAGTSGYVLTSNGSGEPSWKAPSASGGGSTGNANVFYVQQTEDGNSDFMEGELMFTLFGTATESEYDWSVSGASGIGYALTNYAGYNGKVQATGIWNGEPVWAVSGYGGWFTVYTTSGSYEVYNYITYTRKTYPLNKNFTIGE